MTKRLIVLAAFVLFLNIFFFRPFGTVSFSLIVLGIALYGITSMSRWSFVRQHTKSLGIIGIFFLLLLTNIVMRGNQFVRVILGIASLGTIVYGFYILSSRITFMRSLQEAVLAPFLIAGSYLANMGGLILGNRTSDTVSKPPIHEKKHTIGRFVVAIVRSILISIPIIGILVFLLSSADPIFAKRLKEAFAIDWQLFIQSGQRLFFSLFIALLAAPLINLRRSGVFKPFIELSRSRLPAFELSVVMSLVTITLIGFLLVQWPYVFASVPAETNLSQFGITTYSEYVRKGFIELLAATAFIYGLIWLGLMALKGTPSRQKKFLSIVQLVTLVVFSVFIFSIFRRIWLYQTHHGWSLVRIYGGMFLVWIVFISVTLAGRHVWEKRWIVFESIGTALLLLYFAFFNAEQYIALHHPPTVNNQVDHVYLSRMSSDGYLGWKMAFNHAENILMDPKLDTQELIARDDRREIAYAGMVLQHLITNYHNLMMHQGSIEEQKNYYEKVLLLSLSRIEGARTAIEQRANLAETDKQWQLADNNTQYQSTMALLTALTEDEADLALLHQTIFVSYMGGSFSSHLDRIYTPYYTIDSNNFPETNPTVKNGSPLDYFLVWNASETSAFDAMLHDMPWESLMKLHERYAQLFLRIADQPEAEQSFDQDISHNTPFL